MTSSQLTPAQLDQIAHDVRRHANYLNRLAGRIHQCHFPHGDPLKTAADEAERAVEKLREVVEGLRRGQ